MKPTKRNYRLLMRGIRYSPLSFVVLVSWVVYAQGVVTFPELSLEYCHALPAETVDAVITSEKLDVACAQLDKTSRYVGTWWKHANSRNQLSIVPKIQALHECTKVCGIIMPKDHVAHHAVVAARSVPDHFYISMINLPIKGMRVVRLNWSLKYTNKCTNKYPILHLRFPFSPSSLNIIKKER